MVLSGLFLTHCPSASGPDAASLVLAVQARLVAGQRSRSAPLPRCCSPACGRSAWPAEMAFARAIADRVVFMDHGQVVETGSTDFFTSPRTDRARHFLDIFHYEEPRPSL
ncbi:hypothetical protein M3G03_02215 [Aestuariimicrobium sp. p3-SID1156]|uniref:hypothetical protein n=1 Tax=Aestuariimicrobium sp. p3-SID1156 TaxID=2916038 RepID=UPI00223BDCDC|nr:hypothetical protein [Aestuariimicrobium sp. p3-SID1156]MCT1458368.1 hypothetical protein [Aestuariimicrobium sp. p3-SID1156]